MVSEKEIEAARAVLERRIYDEGGCEDEQVPAMVREMLEAAACVRAEANNECGEAAHPAPQPSVKVKPLDEDDYEEIISAAAINMRKAASGIRGQMVTVQDSLDWWVMKETERRILSALTAGKPEQAVPSVAEAERERIAKALEEEADMTPCSEDAVVVRDCARLVRANFSYEDAERLAEETPTAPTAGGGDE